MRALLRLHKQTNTRTHPLTRSGACSRLTGLGRSLPRHWHLRHLHLLVEEEQEGEGEKEEQLEEEVGKGGTGEEEADGGGEEVGRKGMG